jgi:very-short-patch-repair endonuclease
MSDIRKLAPNVREFLEKASSMYGQLQAETFSQWRYSELLERPGDSAIEDLFWIACHLQCASAGSEINRMRFLGDGKWGRDAGVHITPQHQVGRYRVDFLIEQFGIGPDDVLTPVAVELDGHDFHDKDKRQRSYEKARDRDLVRAGYRVLHFTGSDVVRDPLKVAYEALEFVGVFVGTGRDKYDPKDPLGQGW